MTRSQMFLSFALLLLVSLACSMFGVELPSIAGQAGTASNEGAADPLSADGSELPPLPEPNPINVNVNTEQDASAEVTAYPDEDTIFSTMDARGIEYTLEIPAGALLSPQSIRMTPISDMEGLPQDVALATAVHLEPEGLIFMQPATLAISFPGEQSEQPRAAFSSMAGGEDLHLTPFSASGNQYIIPIVNFSSPGVLEAHQQAAIDSLSDAHAPSGLGNRAINKSAGEFDFDDPSNTDFDAMADSFELWYRHEVEPDLKRAVSDSDALEPGIAEYLRWWKFADLHLNGMPTIYEISRNEAAWNRILALRAQARDLLAEALVNAVRTSFNNCRLENDPTETARIMRYAHFIGGLNLEAEVESHGLTSSEREEMLQNCARFKVFLHSVIEVAAEHGTFRYEVGLTEPNIEHARLDVGEGVYQWNFHGEETLRYISAAVTPDPDPCRLRGGDGQVEYSLFMDVNLNYLNFASRDPESLRLNFSFTEKPEEFFECPVDHLPPGLITGWLTSFTINHGAGDPTHLRTYELKVPVVDECGSGLSGSCTYAEREWKPGERIYQNVDITEETIVRITHHPR